MTSPPRIGLIGRLTIAAGIAGLIIGLGGMLAVNRYATRALRERVEESHRRLAERLAVGFDDRIRRTVAALKLEALDEDLVGSDRLRATAELSAALRATGEYDVLTLLDRKGTAVASAASRFLPDPAAMKTRRDIVDDVRATGSAVRVTKGRVPALEIAAPIESPPGTIIGALVAEIPLEVMGAVIASFRLGQEGTASLIDQQGRTLVHQDRGRILRGHRIDIPEGIEQSPAFTVIRERAGEKVLTSVAPTRIFPGAIAIEQGLADAIQPVLGVRRNLILIVLASVMATAAVISFAGRRVFAPIQALTIAVRDLGSGDRSARAPASGRSDEIGVLSEQFNRMANALDERMAELSESNRRSIDAQQRLDDAFANAPIGMAMLSLNGTIQRVNHTLVEFLGHSEERLLGITLEDVTHPSDAPIGKQQSESLLSGEIRNVQGAERRFLRADGTTVWALLSMNVVDDAHGTPVQLFAQMQDITPHKAAERELHRIDRAKSEFVANAAHELRTPLTVVSGLAELLSKRAELSPEDFDEVCEGLQRQGVRARILVERMLDLLRIESASMVTKLHPLGVDEVIRTALDSAPLPEGRTIEIDVDPALTVIADDVALEHVISNLLTNAYRYGGSAIAIRSAQTNGVVQIAIEDNGVGVSRSAAEHLFEPFNRGTDATGPGSGLGLAIVRRSMAAMDGTVRYEKRSPNGARFILELRGHRGSSSRR